jgi:hypothetical protein
VLTASATLISSIAANPHHYYVNIHSKQYPGGAVRAQWFGGNAGRAA